MKLNVQEGGERTATTTCTLKRDTTVEALPNGPNDNPLLSMRVRKMGCDHVDTRFSKYELNVVGAGTPTVDGTAVIIEFRPGQELMITLAQGRVLFDYLEGVVEGDQNPAIEGGEALEVDLADKAQVIKPVEFSPEGKSLGTVGPLMVADGSSAGTTAEDHFFESWAERGISAMTISNSSGEIEIDHLQFSLPE